MIHNSNGVIVCQVKTPFDCDDRLHYMLFESPSVELSLGIVRDNIPYRTQCKMDRVKFLIIIMSKLLSIIILEAELVANLKYV